MVLMIVVKGNVVTIPSVRTFVRGSQVAERAIRLITRVVFVKMTMNVFWEHTLATNLEMSSSAETSLDPIGVKGSDAGIVQLVGYLLLHVTPPLFSVLKSNLRAVTVL